MSHERVQQIEQWMAARLAEIHDKSAQDFGPTTRLDAVGLDSLSEAGLAIELEQAFNVQVSPVILMQHPTIGEIAKYLSEKSDR